MGIVDYDDGTRIIENVPLCNQGNTGTCAQACVTSILNYWGNNINYNELITETVNQNVGAGMSIDRIVWYFRRYNLQAKAFKGNMSNLKGLIDRGFPCIVGFDEGSVQHVVVVVGYNDYREVIFYNDSMYGELTEEPYSDFIRAWNRQRLNAGTIDGLSFTNLIIQVNP